MPPYYYETRLIIRNLKHQRSEDVVRAFERTYDKCHEIQRDARRCFGLSVELRISSWCLISSGALAQTLPLRLSSLSGTRT